MSTEEEPKNTMNRLQMLKKKAMQNNNKLFKVQRPEVLRQKFVDWNAVRVKPWHQKRSDLTDYFNYGYNEHTFQQYSTKIGLKLEQYSSQIQNSYRERLGQKILPYQQAQTLTDLTPLDYGGLNVPFDQSLIQFGGESNNLHFLDSIFFLNNLNYDTSMLSEFDCYCTSEDLLYGNKNLIQLFEELNSKLQQENENDIDKSSFYQYQETIKKLTNSVQRFKQSFQTLPNVPLNPNQFLNQTPVLTNKNELVFNNTVQTTSNRQIVLLEKNGEDNGLSVKENIQFNQEDEQEKRRKKKKDKKIKKDKKEKKDKKRRKHKKDKKNRKQVSKDSMDIEFEHMDSDRNLTPKQVIFQDSESSYLQSNQQSPPSQSNKNLSSDQGLPSEQGNQGISINQQQNEIEDTKRPKSQRFVQVIQDKIVLQQQPKPVWLVSIDQSSPEHQKEETPVKKGPKNSLLWAMNQITGICKSNLPRRPQLQRINKEN